MEYRIVNDANDVPDSPLYWMEQKMGGHWERVFGTTAANAGEAWELLEANRRAMVTPDEIAMLLRGDNA
jgi:hypothetical protein